MKEPDVVRDIMGILGQKPQKPRKDASIAELVANMKHNLVTKRSQK